MIFTCEVSARDDGLGVDWCEARTGSEWCVMQIANGGVYAGTVGGLVALVGYALSGKTETLILVPLVVVLFGLSWGIMWLGARVPAKRRAIYFKRNGAIESPHGLFDGSRVVGPWQTKLGDIANIEVEQIVFPKPDGDVDYTHGVRMILKSGRVFHVAGNLMPDQAHELAVSLSQAREAMRYDVSTTSPRSRSREAVY
jgi:hypothetical protein